MLKFTSADDLARLPKTDPADPVIATLIQGIIIDTLDTEYPHDPVADGYIALVQQGDQGRPLTEIWPDSEWYLTEIMWEGITKQGDFFLAVYLANNQFGLVFVIPDEEWVQGELRECILRNLDPPEEIDQEESTNQEIPAEKENREATPHKKRGFIFLRGTGSG